LPELSKYLIYALIDPRTDEIRYVGKSSSGMARPRQHRKRCNFVTGTTHRCRWLQNLLKAGRRCQIRVVERTTAEKLSDAERRWIADLRAQGCRLVNHTDGGDGLPGRKASLLTRAKMSAAHLGHVCSEETRNRLSVTQRRLRRSDPAKYAGVIERTNTERWNGPRGEENRAAMSRMMKGRVFSATTRARMSTAQKRRAPPSEATRRLRSLSMRGRTVSESARLRISKARGGRPFRDQAGRHYECIRDAGRILGLDSSGISKVLHGKRAHYAGFVFRYTDA
jgi:hypothetical protein